MRLKSYFSGTVEAAMVLARNEMGDDALLVHARPAAPEARHLGAYEVVFGIMEDHVPPPLPNTTTTLTNRDRDAADMPEGADIANNLADSFEVDSTLGHGGKRSLVALVGPPGSGKTTALIQLAARYSVGAAKSAFILTADVFRIAAADQLRTLSSILGVGFGVAQTPAELDQMLDAQRNRRYVFIDTPGLASADMEDAAGLARYISGHAQMDTHLVIPASMKFADQERIASQYAVFGPKKLLFTRLDETNEYRSLVSLAQKTKLPLSFLTQGQTIPDDLEAATKKRIVELVTGKKPTPALRRGAAA